MRLTILTVALGFSFTLAIAQDVENKPKPLQINGQTIQIQGSTEISVSLRCPTNTHWVMVNGKETCELNSMAEQREKATKTNEKSGKKAVSKDSH